MGMLGTAMLWGLGGWFVAIAAVIAYRCLNGGIGLTGILAHDGEAQADHRPAPDRIQMLVMFIFALVAYARLALTTAASHCMPPVPPELVALLAGSHGIYLSGKLTRALKGKKRKSP